MLPNRRYTGRHDQTLLMFENEVAIGVPISDVQEVSHYGAAMDYGF